MNSTPEEMIATGIREDRGPRSRWWIDGYHGIVCPFEVQP